MSNTPSPRHGSPVRTTLTLDSPNAQPGHFVTPPASGGRQPVSGRLDTSSNPFAQYMTALGADPSSDVVSPPLSPLPPSVRKKRSEPVGKRLRPKGGLKIQINEPSMRQYTDYDTSGTPSSAHFSPSSWLQNTPAEPDIQTSLVRLKNDNITWLPIFDIFATNTVRDALKDPAAMERMRHFAELRGHSRDIDFLMQVGELEENVNLVASNIETISSRYTGVAATSPMRLPLRIGRALSRDVRDASKNLLPRLKQIFEEASRIVEHSLAQDVYPDFLKYQVSISLQTIRPGASSRCRGFGEAFCMTDPREYGNPMAFVSPGLVSLTGYAVKDMLQRTCGMFQGPVIKGSCAPYADWVRDGPSEYTELVLSYTKSGSPFWNLVIVAPLVGPEGALKYHLCGLVNVTKMMAGEEDLVQVLRYVSPRSESRPATANSEGQEKGASGGADANEGRTKRGREAQATRYPPSASLNGFFKSFRRRASSLSSLPDANPELPSSVPSTPTGRRQSTPFMSSPAPPCGTPLISPFSRYVVLQYLKPSRDGRRRQGKPREAELPVTFCSGAAVDCLGCGKYTSAEILGLDIFDVLSDTAEAWVTKSDKNDVRDSLARSRAVKLSLTLRAGRHKILRGISLSRKSSLIGSPSTADLGEQGRTSRSSFSRDRMLPLISTSEAAEDFVTYWTPLTDGSGVPRWVVVVLVPEVE